MLTASGGTGGTIYWQGTTSGGTSTAIQSTSQIVAVSGTYYFRSHSGSGCWGDEGSADVIIVNAGSPYTPMETSSIHQILKKGGLVNTGMSASWLSQNWCTFDSNGVAISTVNIPSDTTDVLIFKGICVAPVVQIANSGICKNLILGEGTTVNLQKGNELVI